MMVLLLMILGTCAAFSSNVPVSHALKAVPAGPITSFPSRTTVVPPGYLSELVELLPPAWEQHRAALQCYISHFSDLVKQFPKQWIVASFNNSCKFEAFATKPKCLKNEYGVLMKIGNEIEDVSVGGGTSTFYQINVTHASVVVQNSTLASGKQTTEEFTVDTGAAFSILDFSDTGKLMRPFIIQFSRDTSGSRQGPYVTFDLEIYQIGHTTFQPPLITKFGLPLRDTGVGRVLGMELIMRARSVYFPCGKVRFDWKKRFRIPHLPYIASNPMNRTSISRFEIVLVRDNKNVTVFVDTGAEGSHGKNLSIVPGWLCIQTSVNSGTITAPCLHEVYEILGKTFQTDIASNLTYFGYDWVLGSDISSQLELVIDVSETHATLYVLADCTKKLGRSLLIPKAENLQPANQCD